MRRLGLVVLVLALGVTVPVSAADGERENGWWLRLFSWWTNPLTPALELEREVAADGAVADPDGRARPQASGQNQPVDSEDVTTEDPLGE